MALSVVTIQEIETGNLLIRRSDPASFEVLTRWLTEVVLPGFKDRILGVDLEIARRCAALHVPHRRAYADSLIAATALVHDLTVVTRNTQDFVSMGVRLFDPWTA